MTPPRAGPLFLALLLPAVARAQPGCAEAIPLFEGGRAVTVVCPDAVVPLRLTVIDLQDGWAPLPLSPSESEPPAYRASYVALANQRFTDPAMPPEGALDRDFELFGIPPSFAVLRARLADEARHACHDAVDDAPLASWTGPLARDDQTAAVPRRAPERIAAVTALQARLACEGLLPAANVDGHWGARTSDALFAFRRRHQIPAIGKLDPATAEALLADSRELDFLALLRALRVRVADATGLIEDGSARGEWEPVLGRWLDPAALRDAAGRPPLGEGAPDLLSRATERAARALGLTDPAAAREALTRLGETPRVALSLPAPPAYHSAEMELRVEIDRGDVWYQYPWTAGGGRRGQPVEQRPVLVLWARDGEGEVALVRWPTTIGGWQREKLPSGAVVMKYKDSTPGTYHWRNLVAAPTWFPPPTTPDRELVRYRDGRWRAREDTIGPSYRSAYGLLMLIHHRGRAGAIGVEWQDVGTRTHGTGSYLSVLSEGSHGCHRLFGIAALRLGGFLLAHRAHLVRGPITESYRRVVSGGGRRIAIVRDGRGYLYELDPPIEVRVLEGRILGPVRRPPAGSYPLPTR